MRRAQRRNTIVPATATAPAGQAPPAEQTEPQAASDASTKVGNDPGEDSDDFLESETGSPNPGKNGSESLTPFSRLFKETQEFMDMARRDRTAADLKKRDDVPFGHPGQTQGTAADEITQSLDAANRPRRAIPPQGASRRTTARQKDLRNLAHRSGPDTPLSHPLAVESATHMVTTRPVAPGATSVCRNIVHRFVPSAAPRTHTASHAQ